MRRFELLQAPRVLPVLMWRAYRWPKTKRDACDKREKVDADKTYSI